MKRQGWRALFFFFCFFVIYGTLIPFDATTDPHVIGRGLSRFWRPLFLDGRRAFSIPDVVGNVTLFFPLGFLWVTWRMPSPFAAILQSGAIGFLLGILVETYQLFTPSRSASSLDVFSNTAGAVFGGFGAVWFLAAGLDNRARRLVQHRPQLVLLTLLAIALVADSFYPYEATFDMSTLRSALNQIHWLSWAELEQRLWSGVVAEKLLFFSLFASLIRSLWMEQRETPAVAGAAALLLTVAFTGWIEASKVFFVGRIPNPAYVGIAFIGAAAALLVSKLRGPQRIPSVTALLAIVTLMVTLAELAPFDWDVATESLRRKAARIEWLPFWSYYAADTASAAFDFGKKLLYLGTFGFLVAARREERGKDLARTLLFGEAIGKALGLGLLLESAQLLLASRTPSVTDVLAFGLGAGIGGGAYLFYRTVVDPEILDRQL